MGDPAVATELAVRTLLEAIESRDLRRVARSLAPDCTWQNVPHPPVLGREDVVSMLSQIVCWSDQVRWDVASAAYGHGTAWVERSDRFWIDGEEHTVLCNGVFTIWLETGAVTGVRDYVDLGEWRQRIVPAYERMARRPAIDVIRRHLAAVDRRDPVAMAADYALGAVLDRGDVSYQGWLEIADYFATVPERLGDRRLTMSGPATSGADQGSVAWRITDGNDVVATGTDQYTVDQGRIVRHVVVLDGPDF